MKSAAGLLLVSIFCLAPPVRASLLVLDTTGPGSLGSSGTQSLGWEFRVNQSIRVDGLAFWDRTDTMDHEVGIFDETTHALLVSATVLSTDPQQGTGPWRVHSIAPFLLVPGLYDIAAETGNDNYTFNPATVTVNPSIAFIEDRYLYGSASLAYPTDSSRYTGWFGPSFTIETPEPATLAFLGIGLIGLGMRRRAARRSKG